MDIGDGHYSGRHGETIILKKIWRIAFQSSWKRNISVLHNREKEKRILYECFGFLRKYHLYSSLISVRPEFPYKEIACGQ